MDALCDGEDVEIGAIMQHVEEAGVHSGDSACVIPAMSLGPEMLRQVEEATEAIAKALGVIGLINIQFAVAGEDELYVIEANPRASRTVPFVSKAIGVSLAKIACRLMLGERLADMEIDIPRQPRHVSVKEAVLPFGRFPRADALLGPEMKSTGEVMGVASDYPAAFGKAQAAAGAELPNSGTVFISVTDGDKSAATQLAASFHDMGFQVVATGGTATAIRRMGVPVERIKAVRGLAERGRADRVRRGRPRDQHAHGLGRPRGRVRDPARRDRPRDSLHHDHVGRQRGAAGDPLQPLGRDIGDLTPGAARRRHRSGASCPGRGGGAHHLTEPRTLAPPERRVAVVSGIERLGAYYLVTAHDASGPRDPRPGQFYMLAAEECWGGGDDERPYLPRAFSYARAHMEPDGVSLGFLLEAIGPGTERLAGLVPDDGLALVGPLGIGFRPAAGGARPVLVGGGIGAAPLLCLQEELDDQRCCRASAARPTPRRRRCSAESPRGHRRRLGGAARRS